MRKVGKGIIEEVIEGFPSTSIFLYSFFFSKRKNKIGTKWTNGERERERERGRLQLLFHHHARPDPSPPLLFRRKASIPFYFTFLVLQALLLFPLICSVILLSKFRLLEDGVLEHSPHITSLALSKLLKGKKKMQTPFPKIYFRKLRIK